MGRSNNVNRPYVRNSRKAGSHSASSGSQSSAAHELAASAGRAVSGDMTERPAIEQLERRQMLFSLTISADSVDPTTGLGTASAFFHYYIPYLATSQTFTDTPAETATEGFDQENYGPIGSGRVFATSGLEFRHNINPASDLAIRSSNNSADNNDRWVRANLNETGEFFAMKFRADGTTPNAANIAVRRVSFTVSGDIGGDVTGLLYNNVRADLYLSNNVIASYTGNALRALIGNSPDGTGTFTVNAPNTTPAFDELRFTMTSPAAAGVNTAFRIDDVSFDKTPNKYAGLLTSRAFGAAVALSGPVGATATFTDLYGRDMLNSLAGIPGGGSQVNPGDLDDNGVPDRNDGIGAIRFSGTDSRTSFTMLGGTLGYSDTRPDAYDPNALIPSVYWDAGSRYTLTLKDDPMGLYGDFETAGFGFAAERRNTQVVITGLPPGAGSVIVGSPFVRTNTSAATYNPEGFARNGNQNIRTVTSGFSRTDQGLFLEDGSSIGSVNVNGMVFGASKFNGFVDRLSVGTLMGSVTVNGDLGTLVVATDAGIWSPDPGFAFQDGTPLDQNNKTNGLVVVGRTAGQILIGGRSQIDVTVVGDLNSPTTKPQRDSSIYYELEAYSGAAVGAGKAIGMATAASDLTLNAQTASNVGRSGAQPVVFGSNFYRNDSILGSEIITSQSSGVRIKGELSQQDPFNSEDDVDVYGFAVSGGETINFQGTVANGANVGANAASLYFRIVDSDGVVVAAPDKPVRSDRFVATNLNFKPSAPGIYYIVVMDPNGSIETGAGPLPYTVAISGLATASLGAYRTGAGQGLTDVTSGEGSSITVLSGNIGSVRLGTSFIDGGGADADPVSITNTVEGADDAMSWQGGSLSTPGSIYNITTGSDIGQPGGNTRGNTTITVSIGGDLGSLITGMSPLLAGPQSGNSGDVNFLTLNVGGRIGTLDIRGGVGMDQDATDPRAPTGANSLNISTGLSGGSGDIGLIKVGFHVAGDSMNVTTPAGSTVGGLLISQASQAIYDDGNARSGIYLGNHGIGLHTGAGSDIRFADVGRLDLLNSLNVTYPIIGGTTLELIDDGGAHVQISINGPVGQQVGRVIALPVDGSQGVVIASITADLTGGRTLQINGVPAGGGAGPGSGTGPAVSPGVIGIGHIMVVGDGASIVNISGSVEVDVWRLEERSIGGGTGGATAGGLLSVTNITPGGDFVAVDVVALGQLSVDGDLGRTQVPAFGPQLIGPRLGIARGVQGDVGGAMGTQTGLYDTSLGGKILRAIDDADTTDGAGALDDVGHPFDLDLNGLVVRSGNVQQVRAKGAIGDVILQGAAGTVQTVTANYDLVSAQGKFEGLVGTVYAFNVGRVEVGDGIAKPDPSPLSTTGVFAANNIGTVTSLKLDGSVTIEGPIEAANAQPDTGTVIMDGIESVLFTNAQIRGTFIGSQDLDAFWSSFLYGDDNTSRGGMGDLFITSGNLFSTRVSATQVRSVRITNGFFDASQLRATTDIGTITVAGFRNSTLTGSLDELNTNSITGARDADRIEATGDMNDLTIDITGRVKLGISAANITRSAIDVDNELKSLTVTGAVRSTAVTVGQLPTVTGRDFYASTFLVSGQLTAFTASNTIANTRIEVTGPAGGIGSITAANGISGTIAASGPIGSVTSTAGDITAEIDTTTTRGNVGTVSAGRDLAIRTDVSGNIGGLAAGRNIGTAGQTGVILVRGDLASISIPNGSLYNDLNVGGSITGTVTIGGAVAKPGNNLVSTGSIVAFNTIKGVVINGDYAGDIVSYSGGIASVAINNGSLFSGHRIAAYDGSLTSVTILNGNLYGDIHADFDIALLSVTAGVDGVFGDVGVNPLLSAAVSYDNLRNQLPPGVRAAAGIQGPSITAGRNIVKFSVVGGDVYEASVFAGRSISSISITGNVGNDTLTTGIGSYFAAGDSITSIAVTGAVSNTQFIAGLVDLGSDNALGGTLTKADTIKAGSIALVAITGRVSDSKFTAGMNAGADGVYNTADDTTAIGISVVNTLTLGSVGSNVSVYGDTLSAAVAADARFTKGGTTAINSNPLIASASTIPPGGTTFTAGTRSFALAGGGTVTITLVGPGSANYNAGTTTLRLTNTTIASTVTVSSTTGTLADFDIISADDASLGALAVSAALTGDSDIAIDGPVTTVNLARVEGTGNIYIGGDTTTMTIAALVGGFLELRSVTTLSIAGQFGATNPAVTGEASIKALTLGAVSVTGAARGLISVDRDIASLTAGSFDRSLVRAGSGLGAVTAASVRASVFSAGDSIGAVAVSGDFFDSALVGGVDLGSDAFYGGTGAAADRLSSGSIGAVTVGGNFFESDITAGYYRGGDAFYGTTDDTVAAGRSSIASVTIGGSGVGSTRSTESYRIASSGSLGAVRVGGVAFSGTRGNFATETPSLAPTAGRVLDIRNQVDSRVFTANIIFNQPIDFSTLSPALSVSEVRGNGDIEIRLIEGVDYTLKYQVSTNTAQVVFSRSVTERNLPSVPDRPGPGIYRFDIKQSLFRTKLVGQGLDGNGDGFSQTGDDFSQDAIVGDAGDKITPVVSTVNTTVNGAAVSYRVDQYGPTNLNWVMDDNQASDGLPDTNKPFTVRGFIGDHPDNDTSLFRFAGDVDIYSITLQAGQILRLGRMLGTANLATLAFYDASLTAQPRVGGITTSTNTLPPPEAALTDTTFAHTYLIQQTGTYYIVVGNASGLNNNSVNNPDQFPLQVGDYNFSVEVFDDGDSGFTSPTGSGDGSAVVNAPPAQDFAGLDGILGTSDDLSSIVTNGFRFTRDLATNTVSGTNGNGIVSTRDGTGRLVSTITSAIGPQGHAGVPSDQIASDLDVFHLNNRQPITPGTKMRLTVKLSQFGSDLGSASPVTFSDNRGSVQFGLFDTSLSTGLDDATLVFSPSEFLPYGGTANTTIADNGSTKYGYDANGDFYAEFVVPAKLGSTTGEAGTFAAYIQGVYNTDYQLEVVTNGTGTAVTSKQNVYIETRGGSVNWLQVGGITSTFGGLDISTLGFTGLANNGQSVNDYFLSRLTSSLNSIYQGAGYDVTFSTNPADFEFQPFSTVYLSGTADPVFAIFNSFSGSFNFGRQGAATFQSTQPYGFSQHVDPFNTDVEDDAVVFVPSFAIRGFTPSQAGLDELTQSVTGAISRRVGELMGLRVSEDIASTATTFDPMASNSPETLPGSSRAYSLSNARRRLSTNFDSISNTNFFIGNQNSVSLLDQVLARR